LAPVFDISRLKDPKRGEQIGDLILGVADSTPIPEVRGSRLLNSVFELADPGVVLARCSGKYPPGETGTSPDLT
jgi:hypothetical protein